MSMKLASWGFAAMLRRNSGLLTGKSTPFSSLAAKSALSSIPVGDQWIKEGTDVSTEILSELVDVMERRRKTDCAYAISKWENDKSISLSKLDMAVRLEQIVIVYGLEKAERFFHIFPEQSIGIEAYCVLLGSYTKAKAFDKAELVVQKVQELGLPKSAFLFDLMLHHYYATQEYDKLRTVLHEMEEDGIKFTDRMFHVVLRAYRDTSDVDGVCSILKKMESYQQPDIIYSHYSVAADVFAKSGDTEKALEMLKLAENCAYKDKRTDLLEVMKQYAALGKKEDVLRIWEGQKKFGVLNNLAYVSIISSLLGGFDDVEGAEKILEDWLSTWNLDLYCDFCVPNFLIGIYCKKGLMEKANDLIERTKALGGEPLPRTWDFMASGYAGLEKMEEAMKMMNSAVKTCERGWKPSTPTLASCLEYLREKGAVEEARDLLRSLLRKDIISRDIHNKLFDYMNSSSAVDDAKKALEILEA